MNNKFYNLNIDGLSKQIRGSRTFFEEDKCSTNQSKIQQRSSENLCWMT